MASMANLRDGATVISFDHLWVVVTVFLHVCKSVLSYEPIYSCTTPNGIKTVFFKIIIILPLKVIHHSEWKTDSTCPSIASQCLISDGNCTFWKCSSHCFTFKSSLVEENEFVIKPLLINTFYMLCMKRSFMNRSISFEVPTGTPKLLDSGGCERRQKKWLRPSNEGTHCIIFITYICY